LTEKLFPAVRFNIRTKEGVAVDFKRRDFKKSRTNPLTNILTKEIILQKDEGYLRKINIADWYDLSRRGTYLVTGLFQDETYNLESNIIRIKIRKINKKEDSPEEHMVKIPRVIRPEEIITLMHLAEQQSRWNDYVKYFDLEEIIKDYDEFSKKYKSPSTDSIEKNIIMNNFTNYLKRKRTYPLTYFEIRNEEIIIPGEKARVRVYMEYDHINFKAKYIYTYKLSYRDNFWLVTSLDVSIIK
ncbi:MAG: hypothetical protein KAS39_09025, partial [Actinomycetia bacterium]|nr:hypothetical protein [Actinomycetes bacterium]